MNSPLFCLVVNRAKRLNDMIDRLDVDPLKLVRLRKGEGYREARDTCLRCHQAHTCVSWVELAPQHARPSFCPNLALFESVRRA
jgi:Family of unknown function (DUF6455)